MVSYSDVLDGLHQALYEAGFDVLGCATVGRYNDCLESGLEHYRLPVLGGPESMVAVVGNTKRLWPLFVRAFRTTPLAEEPHPLDVYSRNHVSLAARDVATAHGLSHVARFSFDPPPEAVAIQRLASLAGISEASPVGLCVHPLHGPWFSLRAALVFDLPGPETTRLPATCSRCTGQPCVPRRADAIAASGVPASAITREHFRTHWRAWLAVRDACPLGKAARYGDAQIRYHYLNDRGALGETS